MGKPLSQRRDEFVCTNGRVAAILHLRHLVDWRESRRVANLAPDGRMPRRLRRGESDDRRMIPVLAVHDPASALRQMTQVLGLVAEDAQSLRFGDQVIRLCSVGAPPSDMIPMRLDHVALRIGDADAIHAEIIARGGRLSAGFTPQGPAEIGAFWDRGVRYVFFDGPEGWPVEFCARIGLPDAPMGHDHLAIRSADLGGVETALAALGAKRIAQHVLASGERPVEVRFLSCAGTVFELFDEAPIREDARKGGWIGVLPG